MSNTCSVSIVDNTEERRKRLAAGFRAAGCSVKEYHSHTTITRLSVDILCIHYRDDWPEVLNISRSVAVYYGGAGVSDPDWPNRRDKRPNCFPFSARRINPDGSGSLTEIEISELILLASAISGGQKNIRIPSFLQPPADFTTLIALSILCQGYLAAIAPDELDLDDEFKKRIAEAGAKEAVESAGPKWWLDVFSFTEGDVCEAVGRLREAIEKEWTQSDEKMKPIEKLLLSITSYSNVGEKVVKSALDAISDFLKMQAS